MNTFSNLPQAFKTIQDGKTPFAIMSHEDEEDILLLTGEIIECDTLADIPVRKGFTYDTLSSIPFSQVKERGFEAHDDGAKIRCMQAQGSIRASMDQVLSTLPKEQVALEDGITYQYTDEEYQEIVRRIKIEKIGEGEGSNFVISMKARGVIEDMSHQKALSIFRSILTLEYGSYMSFCYFDGQQYLIGASPERHLTIRNGEVSMNPISGTHRKVEGEVDAEELIAFLRDNKEIFELLMCNDEELKQMSQVCEEGGEIQGPFLKEMSKILHTEYYLRGKSQKDVLESLRHTLMAPTVVGSPLEPACSAIKEYETESRRYYAGILALMGDDENGKRYLDSSIMIRTIELQKDGNITLQAGASLVADSDPVDETKEVKAKLAGVSQTLQNPPDFVPEKQLPKLDTKKIERVLQERNVHLSRYLFSNQEGVDHTVEALMGKSITIIHNADDFAYTLKHMANSMGCIVNVVGYDDFDCDADESDLVIVGPGPGNPSNTDSAKMQKLTGVTSTLLQKKKPMLSICLGHQILCRQLGLSLEKKKNPSQGTQSEIDLFGIKERVGFYNTFAAQYKDILGIEICHDPETGEVHAIQGDSFASMQFHPESILSENGFEILQNELLYILKREQK